MAHNHLKLFIYSYLNEKKYGLIVPVYFYLFFLKSDYIRDKNYNILFTYTFLGRTISVFGRLQVETLESYTKKLANSVKMASQAWEKEISFVLLQLVNGLKSLQAQGIEEIEACLDQFLLIRADKDPHYRLMILNPVSNGPMSLCASALAAMLLFFQSKQTADSAVGKNNMPLKNRIIFVGKFIQSALNLSYFFSYSSA